MNEIELLNNNKELNNSADMLRDILNGDEKLLKRLDSLNLDTKAIKTALDFLLNNRVLTDQEKTNMLANTWSINYRAKPPTPEEFVTQEYMGPAALHTYDRVKNVFLEFMDPKKDYRNLILYPHIGWGKDVAYSDKIFTPEGPKSPKDINIGDFVCTPNGKTAQVINYQDFPEEPIYKIRFKSGSEIKVGGPHYFKAACSYNTKKWNSEKKCYEKTEFPEPCWKIITTEKILEDMKKNPKHRWFIPLTKPVQHTEKKHEISPYMMGAYLGDGSFNKGKPTIVNNDKESTDRIVDEYKGNCRVYENKEYLSTSQRLAFRRDTGFILENLGLKDKRCNDKFIPEEYLYDSIENRIALLQGLMDTDGTVERVKTVPHASYWTSSEQLAKDFMTLVRGLGGIARCYKREKGKRSTCNYDAYNIHFNFPNNDFPIFSLQRKQSLLDKAYNRNYKKRKPQYLYIESIELLEEKGGRCIEIDDEERLFLAGDYVVTHNSYLSAVTTLYVSTCVALMRNPWKYFGLNPATVLTQMLCSYSLKKSSELLLEPFFNLLESSPFFEKVHTREGMIKKDAEFQNTDKVEKIFYTTAAPTSDIAFSGGCNIKCVSSPQGLLGATIITIALSELAFFTDAGKALDLEERIIMADGNIKKMKDIEVGDFVMSPTTGWSEVISIPWEGEDDLYEIEIDDGRTVKCNSKHLWPVTYYLDGEFYDEVVETQFMIDHPEIEFDIKEIPS